MGEADTGLSIVLLTAPDDGVAESIARALVAERLAACVNIVPGVTSVYRWEGAVQRSGEVLMVVKGTTDGFERLRRRVVELHPYDTPEVIDLGVRAADDRFATWIKDVVGEVP